MSLACSVHREMHRLDSGEQIMDSGLTELFLGVTVGAFSPLAVIAAWQMISRTKVGNSD